MKKIKIFDLTKGSCAFHLIYPNDNSYDEIIAMPFLQDIQNLNLDNAKKIVAFLKKWKCRYLPTNCNKILKDTLLNLSNIFNELRNEKIQTVNLNDGNNKNKIETIYSTLNKKIKPTATSKIMHLINKNLFPMWDRNIAEGYSIDVNNRTTKSYIIFMKKIQSILVRMHKDTKANDWDDFISKIEGVTFGAKYSLPKIIDEYNYMKFTYNHPFKL
jgi:hypothetical protein